MNNAASHSESQLIIESAEEFCHVFEIKRFEGAYQLVFALSLGTIMRKGLNILSFECEICRFLREFG
jgi:hypothetical protein